MLRDVHAGAFQPYARPTSLQQAPCGFPSPCNIPVLQTAALRALHKAGTEEEEHESCSSHGHSQSLSDGRLSVGTHLSLMAKRYAYLSLIGEGTSAQVVLAEDTLQPLRPVVAIKVMKRQHNYMGQKEIRALRYLHAHGPASMSVVKLLGSFMHAGHLCLVLERLHGSLLDYLSHSSTLMPALQLTNLRQIAFQLLGSMAVVHAHGVVHADLKPENILLREPLQEGTMACPEVVITDFGSAFSTSETDTAKVAFEMQTLPYRAPEVVAGAGLTDGAGVDAWSLGCILAELALKRPLFPCNSPSQLLAQMEHWLRAPSDAAKAAAASMQLSGSGPVPQETRSGHLEQDNELIARLASSPAPRPTMPSWQSNLSLLSSELVKVDHALADLITRLLCWDPAKRLSTIDALLHPFFDASSPVRHLLQVASHGANGATSMQQLKQLGLQSLMQHAQAASRAASMPPSAARDSRASPAPSCPTPISQRDARKQACKGLQRAQELLKDRAPKQAASAPLLLATATEPCSSPSMRDMLLVHERRMNSTLGSTGAAMLPARPETGLQQEGSDRAGMSSARNAAAPAGGPNHNEGRSDFLATLSAARNCALDAELHPPSASSLHSLEQPRGGPEPAPAPSKQPANSVHSPGSRGRAGRSGRPSIVEALFPEIQSRLPPVSFAMAGYTDMYDFPEAALAVADSFLRDAPSPEPPERPAMTAADQAMMYPAAAVGDVRKQSAASLHRGRDPVGSAAVAIRNPGIAADVALEAAAETGAAAGASATERPQEQAAAAARPAAAAQEIEQRSCRSSVTPHKTGTRDTTGEEDSLRQQQQCERTQHGMQDHADHVPAGGAADAQAGSSMATATASESDSSQAAHESQAGVTIPLRSADATLTQQQGGTSAEDGYVHSRGGSVAHRDQNVRCDCDSKQQPQMSTPNSGLDVLAAAASTVGPEPKGRAGRGSGRPQARTPGRKDSSDRRGSVPDQAAAAGATPGRKRKALRDADLSFSPDKVQRLDGAAGKSSPGKATPGKGKADRHKTPSRTRGRPASATSPVPNGARRRQEASARSPRADGSSVEEALQQTWRSPGTGKNITVSRTHQTPSKTGRRVAATSGRGTPQLRVRASIEKKGAKPWWIV